MKILVLGATGMAGHVISLYLYERGFDITTLSRSSFPYCKNIKGDVFETVKLENILIEGKYDVVINCIGILNNEANNRKNMAIFLNSYLPHFISKIIEEKNTKLIHMSTDCVFSGKTGPYLEDSHCDGKSIYDRTKALGEINDYKNLTFRNSIIGPDLKENGIGLFNWFMKQEGDIRGFTSAIWTGVTTLTLAKAMEKAIEQNLCGLYHLVNNESISKYDLLCLFKKYFKKDIYIKKYDDFKIDKTLINTRKDFQFEVPTYEQMVVEMKEWIDKNKNKYHY
jgi:dTDP-4-dehydrorhamnose reductase